MAVASSNIVLKSLSILLGLFFIFVGIMKIGPYLSKELHRDLVIIAGCGVGVSGFMNLRKDSNLICSSAPKWE